MNLPLDRESLAPVVIAVAVCGGAWAMFVQPRAMQIARLEQELQAAAEPGGPSAPPGLESLAARMADCRERVAAVQRRNERAVDAPALYASFMSLALKHHVRVQAMQPAAFREAAKDSPVRLAQIDMTIQGRYDDVARFVDHVRDLDVYVRPTSLTLNPLDAPAPQQVTARFGCEVLTFAIEPPLNALVEVTP